MKRVLRAHGRPTLADFDVLGQKLQEDADPDRQKPALPKIDSMQFVDVARVELLENRDKPIGGDIILGDECTPRPNSNDVATNEMLWERVLSLLIVWAGVLSGSTVLLIQALPPILHGFP